MSSINAHLAEWSKRLLNIQLVEQAAMTTLCSLERILENISRGENKIGSISQNQKSKQGIHTYAHTDKI